MKNKAKKPPGDKDEPHRKQKDNLYVVGLGASAGGIRALQEFFSRVEPGGGLAYVVVLHLSPQHESSLPTILQKATQLPVTQVSGPVQVQADHIYVIPPTKYLVVTDHELQLAEPERLRGGHTSIDLFFRTLADGYGRKAMAVLLSGTGSDGILGLRRIKEKGGITLAQNPTEAEFDTMPLSAINAGLVDLILPVAEMPARLLNLRERAERLQLPPETEQLPPRELGAESLYDVLTLLRLRTGHDFSQYKRPTLLRRITRRLQVHDLRNIPDYLSFLHEHPEEIPALLSDLLISVTNFFRDHESFAALERDIIPHLFDGKGAHDQIRVWVAGCATGEEAYSIAILLSEYAATLAESPKLQIFATDIDEKAIAGARECRYPQTIALDVSPERLQRFFVKEGDHYRVTKEVRDLVLFAGHNLLRDSPFSKLDLISCRNLLIYLNREVQERLLSIFHFALRPGGFLFLGTSDSAEGMPTLFKPLDKKHHTYIRQVAVGISLPMLPLPLGDGWQLRLPGPSRPADEKIPSPGELHQRIIEQLAPPSVLVNENYDIVHLSEHAGRYLRLGGGEPSRNLFKLALPELRMELRAALFTAKSQILQGKAVHIHRVPLNLDGVTHLLLISVRAVMGPPPINQNFFLVIFDESPEYTTELREGAVIPASGETTLAPVVSQLEEELQYTKEQLRLTIEQYETSTEELKASNEEFQSINEELRSATEELETGKEELQSVNEELTTVNQEYKEKIEEVSRANSDLQNLMSSTQISTIFLDRNMKIKRYTPQAQDLFNITAADIGRPLQHFTHELEYSQMIDDVKQVLRTLQTIEREIRSNDDHWFLARLMPYRTMEDKIDGVVMTFVDITTRKLFEQQNLQQTAQLREQNKILDLAQVIIRDPYDQIVAWNPGAERIYGYSAKEALGKVVHSLLQTEFPAPLTEIRAQLQENDEWEGEVVQITRQGERRVVASHWLLYRDERKAPYRILEVDIDVSRQSRAEQAVQTAERQRDEFLAMLAHELRNPLTPIQTGVAVLRKLEHLNPQAIRSLDLMASSTEHLKRMIDDLLDISRITSGTITLQQMPVNIATVLQLSCEQTRRLLESRRHELALSLPQESLWVIGDNTRLVQAVTNLLTNAAKYTPNGGHIAVTAESRAGEVILRVRDNGIGIAPALLPELFDVFVQGKQPLDRAEGGLGLGLHLVKRLVSLHGGTIEAYSEGSGRGSEFVLRLPQIPEPVIADAGTAKPPADRTVPAHLRILVVDDNSDIVESMTMFLELQGHEVKSALNGPRALEIAATYLPRVVLLDIGLPGMDGFEVARRLRKLSAMKEAVLIAISGYGDPEISAQAKASGIDQHLLKPLNPNQLAELLTTISPPDGPD